MSVGKTFYIFCELMETGNLAQAFISLIEWNGDTLNYVRLWFAIIIFLLWLSVLIYVIKDANARSSSFWFPVLAAIIIILFTPIFGLILYIAIRPQWRKWDKTPWRDTLFQETQVCANCWEFNRINHMYCTSCWESLHTTCRECETKYSRNYSYCPNCGAPSLEE